MTAAIASVYFAWVDPTATTFNSAYARVDEHIASFKLEHLEGQIPTLTVEIKNPRIGLLNPGRLLWAWLSWTDGIAIYPLFFGRLVGIPSDILNEVITVQLIARASNYVSQKQIVAEGLKIFDGFDPIWFDPDKRDDPDAILEGYSSLYHVDRISNVVSVSDILIGEDGTISINPADVAYDSVKMMLQQSPLAAVNVKADVTWRQQYRGSFFVGQWSYPTYGEEAFVSDWAKTGTDLGSGYRAAVSWAGIVLPSIAADVMMNNIGNQTISYHWQNTATHHQTGDTMSIDINMNYPVQPIAGISGTAMPMDTQLTQVLVSQEHIPGIINPGGYLNGQWFGPVDSDGNPNPINQPAYDEAHWLCYQPLSNAALGKSANATLTIGYDADRQRQEHIEFTLLGDVQPILVDPLAVEDTETITLRSVDLSTPIFRFLNWQTIAGQAVSVGTIIFPNNPYVAGQSSSQICISAGTAGTVEPIFSNIPGDTTVDGTVTWSSLGPTPPSDSAPDWQRLTPVSLGTLLLPMALDADDLESLVIPGQLNWPPTGVNLSQYQVLSIGASFPGCALMEVTFPGFYGGIGLCDLATFSAFTNPTGQSLFVCVQAGTTGEFHVTFPTGLGQQVTDGTVIWQNIGEPHLPIGGWPGMVGARSYFPSTRGITSLVHLISRARAKIRRRARAVQISCDCRWSAYIVNALSCRVNATITDPRLPGGTATGKVVAYQLMMDGDRGTAHANITIGCSVGNGGTALGVIGTEVWSTGYVNPGYQQYSGAIAVTPTGDVAFNPPIAAPVDDGLIFPLTLDNVVIQNSWHGFVSTADPITILNYNNQIQQAIFAALPQNSNSRTISLPGIGGAASEQITTPTPDWITIMNDIQNALTQAMGQGCALWYDLVLKPLNVGPFQSAYVIGAGASPYLTCVVPQTIDLAAPSTG